MPTVSYTSKIKAVADLYTVSLNVRHYLVVGKPSDTLYHTTTRFPEDMDVLASSLPVTIAGSFDGCKVSAGDIKMSFLAQNIASYFQTNAKELGLSTVSDVYLDNDNEGVKVLLTLSRQYPPARPELRPHALLVALELDFLWKTIESSHSTSNREDQSNIASHPFSQKLSLPFRSLLDNVLRRFITWQCVKRYPLIFGPWCQQLDIEALHFPVIFTSILNIVKRSSNESFRDRCYRLIKILRHRHMTIFTDVSSSLSTLADSGQGDLAVARTEVPLFTDEEALHFAMERLYRDGLRRPLFKGLTHRSTADKADDEELSQDHICLPTTRFEEQLFLDDLPISDAQGVISHPLMDSHLSDDSHSRNTLSVDMELDHIDDLLLLKDNLGSLDSDFEQEYQRWARQSGLPPLQVNSHEQWDRDISSTMIDFSDSDGSYDLPCTYHAESRHGYANLHTVTESVSHCVAHDHVTTQKEISQDSLKTPLRLGQRSELSNSSQSLSPYRGSPSGTSHEMEALSPEPQPTCWRYMCEEDPFLLRQAAGCTPQFPGLYELLDDDPHELLLSDPDSSYFDGVNIEDDYGLEEFEGGHLGYDPDVSQHPSTLLITCPHRDRERNVKEAKCENGEPAKLINVESLDGVRAQRYEEEWEEDGMLVVDF